MARDAALPLRRPSSATYISASRRDCIKPLEGGVFVSSVSPGTSLRAAVEHSTILIPGAFNALAARLIERAGFRVMYLSGAAFSAGALALPDIGLFTLTELVAQTTCLTRAASIPLIVDADTGFGEAVNVERTVTELMVAGAAAIQLEDQRMPKRCGHLSGKSLVEPAEMGAKIRAAVAARGSADTIILARTDARGVVGLDEAIERAKRYVGAGADWIFPEALATREEFEQFARAIDAPLVANMTEFGKSELLPLTDFQQMGYAGVLLPVTLLRVAMKAVAEALAAVARDGTQKSLLERMQSRQELYDLLGYTEYEARDRAYFQCETNS
jgi:methylisocitrate lyase